MSESKQERIKNHVNDFKYSWIINYDIADWYGTLQKLLKEKRMNKTRKTDCDKCYGSKTKECPNNCLTSHIRYI